MKIFSIINFTIDYCTKIETKVGPKNLLVESSKSNFDTKNFGRKVDNRQYFHMKNSLFIKKVVN